MVGRVLGVVALVAVVGASSVAARGARTTGVLTGVGDRSVQVTMKNKEVVNLGIDDKTAYQSWATHKPWQGGSVDSRSLVPGHCVSIEQRSDANGVASLVWINVDGVGTIWDPCRSLR